MVALRTAMVAVGELRVSSDRAEVLTTFVGSCVAVALCDRVAGVAGLLHAVLPEPLSCLGTEKPSAYYVDSGVRSLVDETLRAGATRRNLRAAVVGGAALGHSDSMGIGLRNLQAAMALLQSEGIAFSADDVGGNEGRRVLVEVATGNIAVSATKHEPALAEHLPAEFSHLTGWLAALGPNPSVAGALLEVMHVDDLDWAKAGAIIARDAVLALQILRLSNSEAYGRPGEVGSLESAVRLLGPKQVRRLCVLAATARHAADTLADLEGLEPSLRRHASAAAIVVGRLMEDRGELIREEAVAMSLLHSVGVIATRARSKLGAGSGPSLDGEQPDSALLGASVLSAWNFPERMVEAMRLHRSSVEEDLAGVVNAGCSLAQLLGIPCGYEPLPICLTSPPDAKLRSIVSDLRAAGLLEGVPPYFDSPGEAR